MRLKAVQPTRRDDGAHGHARRQLQPTARTLAPRGPVGALGSLQRAVGNRATSRLIQAARGHPEMASARGASHDHPTGLATLVTRRGSAGRPLDPATRLDMEARFGADFGDVRVHTDDRSAEAARQLAAHAYTVGSDVFFGHSRYQPTTTTGRRLLAHELVHVLQQRATAPGVGLAPRLSQRHDPAEREAEAIGERVAEGPAPDLRAGRRSIVHIRPAPRREPVIARKESFDPPSVSEENPAGRMVRDLTPGETQPAINGITVYTGAHIDEAIPTPGFVARAVSGGFECKVDAPIDLTSNTDMIVAEPPGRDGWWAEAPVGWLVGYGELVCSISSRPVPLLLRHDTDNQRFVDRVKQSENEHHADAEALHKRYLKPYHDRVAAAARTARRGASAEACAEAIDRDLDRVGTITGYATDWATAAAKWDGPGGSHHDNADLSTDELCMQATLVIRS